MSLMMQTPAVLRDLARPRRVLTSVTVLAVVAGGLASAPAASAAPAATDDVVTSQEVLHALQGVEGDLVRTPLAATGPLDGGAASGSFAAPDDVLQIEVPATAKGDVELSLGGFSLGIGLPNADESGAGEVLGDGTVVYPSAGESANAVVPTDGGVQLLSVLESSEASQTYAYDLELPAGYRLETTPDGGAHVVGADGTAGVVFEPAWAVDAAGRSVPTHYTVQGSTLTQVVEHQGLDGVAYPVVADPLPVVVIVITAAAAVVVAALALGVATWLVVEWWNHCRSKNQYPQLSTKNGFTARCVK